MIQRKPIDPRTVQKAAAAAAAIVGCIASFKVLSPEQAAAVCTTIAALAALWEPTKS